MEDKPLHFDGSVPHGLEAVNEVKQSFQMTDESRVLIGRNPYSVENTEE